MATVCSLICWGGRTGKTVSISASTDVVTSTKHGLRNGAKLWPSGTLPSELNTSTPVYARSTGEDTFTLHASSAGAIANTGQITFAGSSTYAAVVLKSDLVVSPSTALSTYGLSDLSRWGSSGSERIYDGLVSAISARSTAALPTDEEVFEFGEAFTEKTNADPIIEFSAGAVRLTTTIAGIRSAGFHGGRLPPASDAVLADGYILNKTPNGSGNALYLNAPNAIADGLSILLSGYGYSLNGIAIGGDKTGCLVQKCVIRGRYDETGAGIGASGQGTYFLDNVVTGMGTGFSIASYAYGIVLGNNTAVNNVNGFYCNSAAHYGYYYNNLSVGNTSSNWNAYSTAGINAARNNAGLSGEAWMVGSGATRITVATTDLYDYASGDFRPALSTSPQVDSGTTYYRSLDTDVSGGEVPNYNNGGTEAVDIGAFEFDHGYGNHPASHTLTLDNVAVGSRVLIRDQTNTTTHYDQLAASSTVSATIALYGDSRDNWKIKVRKASAAPFYQPWETLMTATAGSSSIYVSQIPDE